MNELLPMNNLLKAIRDHFSLDWPGERLLNHLIQFLIEKEWYHEPREPVLYRSILKAEGYAVNIEGLIQFLAEKGFPSLEPTP